MKKLIALMLVLVMAVSFAACSQPAAEEPATTETTTPAEGTTEEAPAAGQEYGYRRRFDGEGRAGNRPCRGYAGAWRL